MNTNKNTKHKAETMKTVFDSSEQESLSLFVVVKLAKIELKSKLNYEVK